MGDFTAPAGSGTEGRALSVPAPAGPEKAPAWLPGLQWRRRVLAAPGLALLGVALLVATGWLDTSHGRRAEAVCHQVPLPWGLFALAYGALLCGLAAPVLCRLFFRAAARAGRAGAECWQGTLAVCICVANVLALVFEAVTVYGLHAEAADPYWRCSGAAVVSGLSDAAGAGPYALARPLAAAGAGPLLAGLHILMHSLAL